MTSPTIATHLITALQAAGIAAEEAMDSIQLESTDVVSFSVVRVWAATGPIAITGITRHGADDQDEPLLYSVDYTPADHLSFLAERTDADDCLPPIYNSEGQHLSLADDTAALTDAITPYYAP